MKKNITLADIAKKTGYSVNTISHALHDKSDIAQDTKKLIKKTAKEMGYIINSSASFLRSGISKSIAIIVGDISNPHFSIMIKEIENNIKSEGYTVFVLNTDEDETSERQAIISAKSKNVDGIIICPVQKTKTNIKFLNDLGVPFTLIGRYFHDIETNYVVCDDFSSGFLAAEHLIKNNHRNILYINGPGYISSARERLAGIKRAYIQYGIEFNEKNVYEFRVTVENSVADIKNMLLSNPLSTALICFSDLLAMESAYVLKLMQKRIPEDFSIMGFDNIESKFFFPLMLTTISSSKTKMSAEAVNILLEMIENKKYVKHKIILPTKLIERESTRKI